MDAISNHRSAMLTSAPGDKYSIFRNSSFFVIDLFEGMDWIAGLPKEFFPLVLLRRAWLQFRACMQITSSHDLANQILRPSLSLFVNPANVFANNAQKEEHDAGQECNRYQQGRKTLWRLVQKQFGIQGEANINKGKDHYECSQQRRCANRHDGKCENSVGGKLH